MTTLTRRAFLAGAATTLATLAACSNGAQDDPAADTTSAAAADANADSSAEQPKSSDAVTLTSPLDNGYSEGIHHATIEVQDYGTIELELNATNTPITVSNFADLVNEGFYDGLTFHRIIAGFMAQGGDPAGNGTGGAARTIKGEFSENGVVNAIRHKRGVISMARSSQNDSASSQFFIMQEDKSSLDGKYAAFGKVTSGIEVIDALCQNVPVQDSNGTVASADQPVITSIRMVD